MFRVDQMIAVVKPTHQLKQRIEANATVGNFESIGILIPGLEDEKLARNFMKVFYREIISRVNKLMNIDCDVLTTIETFAEFEKFFSVEICKKVFIPSYLLQPNLSTH